MKYNPEIHHRRSIRLKEYNYSQAGLYFVTICTQNKTCLFGDIVDGKMQLNEYGKFVDFTWSDLPRHNVNIILDTHIIMPNHFHSIVRIVDEGKLLSEIMRQFKTFSARRINKKRSNPLPVWQRNYYEHIIRNDESYFNIYEYIINTPLKWIDDKYHVP